MFSVSQHQLCL